MPKYTLEDLREYGPKFAMALLLKCLKSGESFVTYGVIRDELQYQLHVDRIFSTHIGHVAGTLMEKILEVDSSAPLINALITRSNGLPGNGVGWYFAKKYKNKKYEQWEKLPKFIKEKLVNIERNRIFKYSKWDEINNRLFGNEAHKNLRSTVTSEVDGFAIDGKNYGGPAESKEHLKLKNWVALNPHKIGFGKSFDKGVTESKLLSGDTIDVLFSDGTEFVTVEVKSCRSNEDDLKRGIYQCVKYRAIKEAEHFPNKVTVQTMLITESELNGDLKSRANLLGVKYKCVSVNKNNK